MAAPNELARTYFDGWQAGDFDRVRSVLSDDADFRGPLGTADGADECVAGLQGMSKMMTGMDIKAMVGDDRDVITFYDLLTEDHDPIPTANWMHVVDGKIAQIRATFDPRPIVGG